MLANAQDVICRYHYDPLDRLVSTTPRSDAELQRFYCKSRLVTEIQGLVTRSFFQQDDQLLAQQNRQGDSVEASLLATDQMRSVLQAVKAHGASSIAYSPYGHRSIKSSLLSVFGFNGERADPITVHYLLGNGYRAFNPVLMRFNSPDNFCPFGKGGLNAYAYCLGDPVNRCDESGHISLWKSFKSLVITKKNQCFLFLLLQHQQFHENISYTIFNLIKMYPLA
ncbi:RHS repeat-associated core domain-containing protein [Pseudomonas sp. LB3P81]